MWDINLVLGGVTDVGPSSRRRAYSDPRQKGILRLPLLKRSASPLRLYGKNTLHSSNEVNPRPGSPTSSGYGSGTIDGPAVHSQVSFPVNIRSENIFYRDGQDGSPRSSSPYSHYAGLAVGSLLGSGPLNGHPLNTIVAGLSPVSETSAMSTSPLSTISSTTEHSASASPIDLLPLRRPRLSSLSEVPSVAPIPENLPLMDTPPRPPLRQEDLEPLPHITDDDDASLGSGKGQQPNTDSKTGNDFGVNSIGLQQEQSKQKQQDESHQEGNSIAGSGTQQQGGGGGSGGGFRPRAGTWSMANSRRLKIKQEKEEEVQARQRRKSGDDILNATTKEKEKKKEVSPGFLEAFRPRSKSDAAKGKKPNLMTTVKNAVQHTLVSPGGNTRSGRRSGDATPVEHNHVDDVYHTWHAGSGGAKSTIGKVWELFRLNKNETSEERQRRKSGGKHEKGQLHRRHSMDPDRRRHGSGGFAGPYIRGDDPGQAAIIFRDCRGLPAAAPFLESVKRSELEEDESQILVKFFKYHHTYDLIPTSAKLVIFDTRLQVKKAFYALVYNGVRAAPLWDAARQQFVGMLTITDFIRILQSFYNSANRKMEELEEHRLEMWRTLLKDDGRKLISISPNECLYDAIRSLIHHKIHRLPVIDPSTGNVLYIITHKRILKFLYLYINELPKPSILQTSLRELEIGTFDNIETAHKETLIIEALNKFVQRRISALPIVDAEGKLVDIYAKFDVINLAAEGTYHNLDVTLQQANEYRNEWFEGVLKCDLDETMGVIMERIVRAEVHRLVVVDKNNKVIGIISLSDILNVLVLKPCHDDPESFRKKTIAQMEAALSGEKSSPDPSFEDALQNSIGNENLDKTGSEDSVVDEEWREETQEVDASTTTALSSEEQLQDRKSSAESEEFELGVNRIPDSMTQQGVISISG